METGKITVKADTDYLDEVLEFIETAAADMPMKMQNQLALAIEEIFVNIAHYAYKSYDGGGEAVITASSDGEKLIVTFEDMGVPYNPLKKDDPDIEASADERQIGGLGIFMAKKLTDGMEYTHADGKNILTIYKNLPVSETA
ncbi:MAG: ATP-binding protein [Ruminococcus sp.]|jgi:anti-sigma regulatory factor (Ser/Thr protein kinase)|nr:ATP-binding protein [Ruminococcus sp.]